MNRHIKTLLLLLLALVWAGPASAAFQENVTRSDEWGEVSKEIDRLLIVIPNCHEIMDCKNFLQKIHQRIREEGPEIRLVSVPEWQKFLFGLGKTSYSTTLRAQAMAHFGVAAIAEVNVVNARRSEGFGSATRSVVNLELTIFAADGSILVHATGTGKPKNVVSGPEKVGGRVNLLRIFS